MDNTTQTCTVKSLRRRHACVVRVCKFPAKFCFHKQPRGTNDNAEEKFVLEVWTKTFSKTTSHSLRH